MCISISIYLYIHLYLFSYVDLSPFFSISKVYHGKKSINLFFGPYQRNTYMTVQQNVLSLNNVLIVYLYLYIFISIYLYIHIYLSIYVDLSLFFSISKVYYEKKNNKPIFWPYWQNIYMTVQLYVLTINNVILLYVYFTNKYSEV